MDTEEDQKSVGSNVAESGVEEAVEKMAKEPAKVVKQQTSTSDASQPSEVSDEPQPAEPQQDEEAGEAEEGAQEETSAEDLRELEDELDKITVSVPALYVLLFSSFYFAENS